MWLALALPLVVHGLAGDGLADGLRPLVEGHCVGCHSGSEPEAELDLAGLLSADSHAERRETLAAIRAVLRADDMPPAREPRPPVALVEEAIAALERALGPAHAGDAPRMRRLGRTRYANAVRDLFGIAYPARELFPPDDVGARFDGEAASAGASELHVERWIAAAEEIAARALPSEDGSETREIAAEELALEGGAGLRDGRVALYSRGRVSASVVLPRRSRYRLEVVGWGDLAGDERPRIVLDLDRTRLGARELTVEAPEVETLALELEADGGAHELGASFVNDHHAPEHPDPGERDRNAHVARLVLTGPLDPPPETAFTRALASELERGGLAGALEWLGRRVWRRPLAPDERERLLALSDAAADDRARLRTALVALLASPHFLYLPERADARDAEPDFELATRLAGLLWASVPDDALLDAASSGALASADERERQVERMLRDARARALVTEFGAQWLGWGELARATPDRRRFPAADAALIDSMRQECEAFFEALLREARPLDELVAADFAFVDERLAALYGIEGVEGEGVRRVPLADSARGGVLGQAGILTVTSNPTRTAPVQRGKWVLETLLGRRVPPPPPGVGVIDEAAAAAPADLRAELARHRADPACAVCHAELDPLGLALEGFDAIGRARSARELDARGELPDGTVIDGVEGLRRYVLASGDLAPALAEALFVYALGREPEPPERAHLCADVAALADGERTLPGLIHLVTRQPAFLGSTR